MGEQVKKRQRTEEKMGEPGKDGKMGKKRKRKEEPGKGSKETGKRRKKKEQKQNERQGKENQCTQQDREYTGTRREPRAGGAQGQRGCGGRPANVGVQRRKGVKKLIKLEGSLTIKVDAPGQARKIGSSIGMERAMSTANRDSHAGRVDEGD